MEDGQPAVQEKEWEGPELMNGILVINGGGVFVW
jgi:hypothetical protein